MATYIEKHTIVAKDTLNVDHNSRETYQHVKFMNPENVYHGTFTSDICKFTDLATGKMYDLVLSGGEMVISGEGGETALVNADQIKDQLALSTLTDGAIPSLALVSALNDKCYEAIQKASAEDVKLSGGNDISGTNTIAILSVASFAVPALSCIIAGSQTLDKKFSAVERDIQLVDEKADSVEEDVRELETYVSETYCTNADAAVVSGEVSAILQKIPEGTDSGSNKLVNNSGLVSAIQTYTANYKGYFNAWDPAVLSDESSYLVGADGVQAPEEGDIITVGQLSAYGDRTKAGSWLMRYVGKWEELLEEGWQPAFQYKDTPFTDAQLSAIDSGIDADTVSDIKDHMADTDNPHNVTKAQVLDGTSIETSDIASKAVMHSKISDALSAEISGKADKTWVEDQGYLTEVGSDYKTYADTLASLSVDGYVTSAILSDYQPLTEDQISAIDDAVIERQTVVTFTNGQTSAFTVTGELDVDTVNSWTSEPQTEIASVKIGTLVASIGHDAFSGCYVLTSLTMPNSITDIRNAAFSGCTGLSSMMLPGSIVSIGSTAFIGCYNLANVAIPDNVASIGQNAFYECNGLSSILVKGKTQAEAASLLAQAGVPAGCTIETWNDASQEWVEAQGYLTEIGDAYKTYADTKDQLSADGYATSADASKVIIKDPSTQGYEDGLKSDLSVVKLNVTDYAAMLHDGTTMPNALYIVSSDGIDAYGQQIKNLSAGIDLSDAVNVEQLNKKADLSVLEDYLSSCMQEVEWAELTAMKANAQLVPGMQYRITDYVATTNGDCDSMTANHPFDIIVTADSASTLNEVARAAVHDGDTYFTEARCKLEVWQVWYCLDNDNSKFTWAQTDGTGKGVIYRLIDEFGNDVPYDFKGLVFKALIDLTYDLWPVLSYNYYYTFFYNVSIDDGTGSGDPEIMGIDGSTRNANVGNKVGKYFGQGSGGQGFQYPSCQQRLLCNMFGNGCNNNVFDCAVFPYLAIVDHYGSLLMGNCSGNVFGKTCYHNILKYSCTNNVFGNDCSNIILGDSSQNNSFGCYCFDVMFSSWTYFDSAKTYLAGEYVCNQDDGKYYVCTSQHSGDWSDSDFSEVARADTARCNVNNNIVESSCKYLNINIVNDTLQHTYQYVTIKSGISGSYMTNKVIVDNNVDQLFNTVYQLTNSQTISV